MANKIAFAGRIRSDEIRSRLRWCSASKVKPGPPATPIYNVAGASRVSTAASGGGRPSVGGEREPLARLSAVIAANYRPGHPRPLLDLTRVHVVPAEVAKFEPHQRFELNSTIRKQPDRNWWRGPNFPIPQLLSGGQCCSTDATKGGVVFCKIAHLNPAAIAASGGGGAASGAGDTEAGLRPATCRVQPRFDAKQKTTPHFLRSRGSFCC